MKIFDSHSHYTDEKFEKDRAEVLRKIQVAGIDKIISVGYDLQSSLDAIKLANEYDFIYATCGISPNDIPATEVELENQLDKLEELISQNCNSDNKRIVAIGEIGLDYYWNKENKKLQKKAFASQIMLANKYNLPISIHTREAVDDTLQILRDEITPIKRGIFHCCPLNRELVNQGLKLGFLISFAGPVTFKNSKNADEIINIVPLDKMLIETDCPYLAPEPVRGSRNDSSNLKYIIEKMAIVKNVEPDVIAESTYKNAEKIFLIN